MTMDPSEPINTTTEDPEDDDLELYEKPVQYVILPKWLIAALIVMALGVVYGFLRDYWDGRDERERAAASALESCQTRNSGNEVFRIAIEVNEVARYDALGKLITSPNGQAVIQDLRDAVVVPSPAETDRDCNGDVTLTAADYNPDGPRPAGLPIPIPPGASGFMMPTDGTAAGD